MSITYEKWVSKSKASFMISTFIKELLILLAISIFTLINLYKYSITMLCFYLAVIFLYSLLYSKIFYDFYSNHFSLSKEKASHIPMRVGFIMSGSVGISIASSSLYIIKSSILTALIIFFVESIVVSSIFYFFVGLAVSFVSKRK